MVAMAPSLPPWDSPHHGAQQQVVRWREVQAAGGFCPVRPRVLRPGIVLRPTAASSSNGAVWPGVPSLAPALSGGLTTYESL